MCVEQPVDEPTDTTSDPSPDRQFKLTPLSGDETMGTAPPGGGQKWGRRLLLGGAVVTPLVVTIESRRAYALPTCSQGTKTSIHNGTSLSFAKKCND
jgi:hypothetical protein